ncbi:MAG: SLC13 family permease [Peptococcaceae bacterium]
MVNTITKKDLFWLHVLITSFFMFGFGYLPAPTPITPLGMKMLGVFLGLIYGWSFGTLIWPSIMGMLALVLTDCIAFKELLALGFANDTVVFLLFIFMFTAAIEQEGVTAYMANWCISRKILLGRPWLLSFALLLGAMLTSAFTNSFASILIFWGIFYNICKQAGYKPYEKYPTVMILGIAMFAALGSCLLPYRTSPLVMMGAYSSLTGVTVDFARFMIFIAPMLLLANVAYIAVCRYILRIDLSALKTIDIDFIQPEDLVMTKRQKIVMSFLLLFIVLAVLQSILPETFILGLLLKRLTTTGIVMIMLLVMLWLKVDGEPLVKLPELAKNGIIWDMLLLFIIIFPLSSLMMGDDTGIKAFMVGALQPIFNGVSPLIFMVAALLLPSILTNFANNIVVGMIFLQIICSLADPLGVNATPMVLTLMVCCNLAFYTPAASAFSAMVFGNTNWIKGKDIYTMGGMLLVLMAVVVIAFGLFWGNLIF